MRTLGIRSKILVLCVGLVAIAGVLSAAASLLYTRSLIADYDEALKEEAAQQGNVYAQTAGAFITAAQPSVAEIGGLLHGAIQQLANDSGQGGGGTSKLLLVDARMPDSSSPDGYQQLAKRLVGLSRQGFVEDNAKTIDAFNRAKDTGAPVNTIDSHAQVFLVSFPIKVGGQTVAIVGMTLSAEDQFEFAADKKAEATRNGLIIAGAVMAFVSVVGAGLAWWLSRGIVRPVKELTEVAEKVSMGDLNVTVVRHSNDEIGELADSFSRMVTAVKFYAAEDAVADVDSVA